MRTALFVAATVVAIALAGCGGTDTAATPTASPTPTPTQSVLPGGVIDNAANQMCRELRKAKQLRDRGETQPPADGFPVSVDEMNSVTATLRAQTLAIQSQVPEIKRIVEASPGAADLGQLQAWCTENGRYP